MVLTRNEAKSTFAHVMDNVLGRKDGSALKSSLVDEGIDDIFSLMSLDESTIDGLKFKDQADGDALKPIRLSDKMLLKCFLHFVTNKDLEGTPINDHDWTNITQEEFDEFRISPTYIATRTPTALSLPATRKTGSNASTNPTSYSPADIFRRGIKKDATLFPVLKDEKFNDSWHRSFVNQARAQDLSEVLDPTYKPKSSSEEELFNEKQKFVYAILESKVLTDRGKAIVRDFEDTFDAQAVYKKLTEHHLKSTKAMIESSTILSYITSVRLGSGEWNGTTEGFITHWTNQVRLYERQVPSSDYFSDGQKRIMLENAVHPITELRQVKNNADLQKTNTGKALTYDEYLSLLLSAAAAYDNQFAAKAKSKRHVFTHDQYDATESYEVDDSYDIDVPVSSLLANATERYNKKQVKFGNRAVHMPRDKWYNLDSKNKEIWDKLDDKAKSIILGYDNTAGTSKSPPSHQQSNFKPKTSFQRHQANLHELTAYDFLQAFIHETDTSNNDDTCDSNKDIDIAPTTVDTTDQDTMLVNAAKSTNSVKLPPGDIRRVMSKSSTRFVNKVEYCVSKHQTTASMMSLVDRGANGGVAGDDVRVIFKTNRNVDIRGIDNHQVTNIPIGTVGGVVTSQKGPIIIIMHQYALLGKGSSIHSPCQLEAYHNDVNDKSVHVKGGLQRIQTLDGYTIPLCIKAGLARMNIRPYTDEEWDSYPHVFLTSESEWNPSIMDHDLEEDEQWFDAISDLSADPSTNLFDEFGDYRNRVMVNYSYYFDGRDNEDIDHLIDQCISHVHGTSTTDQTIFYDTYQNEITNNNDSSLKIEPKIISSKTPDFAKLRPLFGWLSSEIIEKTFKHTTQYARLPSGTLLKKVFKSPNPALNVFRRNESVACDIVYADTPAIFGGETAAVLFVGTDTQVTDIYGIKTDKQFINTLEDNIIQRGAPNKLVSDRAQVNISNKVLDILRTYCIKSWQSEPYQQHQNPAERRFQTLKSAANRILDRTGAPPYTWLLCLKYVCYLLNHTFNVTTNGVPLTLLTGSTVDISPLLRFHFWQKVYYKAVEVDFPSNSPEEVGHIVGISEHCGHAMTWKLLTEDTQVVIHRSLVRPFSLDDPNIRADMFGGEEDAINKDPIIKSCPNSIDGPTTNQVIPSIDHPNDTNESKPVFNPEDLVGRSFLMDEQEDGQRFRAKIVKMIDDHESKVEDNPTRKKFLLSINDDSGEEIITYNKLLDYLQRDEENEIVWKFRRIISHQGPLTSNHPEYKGSTYNVQVEWETGEITTEPLNLIAADDPIYCAIYARDNKLLDQPGWKRFKSIAKRQKNMIRLINQAKLRSFNTAPRYKYGYEVPRDYAHALRLDAKNGNTKWQDARSVEMNQIHEYETFIDKGHHSKTPVPAGYKKIRVHLVFDVKHDGRHKARLVADGHLTEVPLDSVYSGVVSIRGFRITLFLAELNHLELWATDIGNAYLEAFTSEKVYIIAGPEFGELEGHILIVSKALYGLRSSGARWHDKFSDCMRELGFFPCKAEPDIWMRKAGDVYEYIAVYVDDLAIAMKNPQEFIDILEKKYKFKTKGSGPISFHLGMDFHRDKDGTLCVTSLKYIEKMVSNYEKTFGELPKQVYTSPLEKGDHPELDTSDFLEAKEIVIYQSMIGALQWAVTIGRFDIQTAVMTLSGFRAAPRKGHLDRAKRIYGYLSKMRHAAIRIRTEEPDYSDIPDFQYDWSKSVYGELHEVKPSDAPEPLGNYVTMTHYVDANLMHDVITGRSVTGILHLANKTPLDTYSKKQSTVETATYGSEFVAARTCVEQIIELRTLFRYLGVPIRDKSYMFGDNKSVVDSSMQVHAKLHKRHTILSFHRVRECIASGMVGFYFINGNDNPADILSKHWGYSQIWPRLKTLLFWMGDTMDVQDKPTSSQMKGE
jgi:Reverse transcriptase (RNA-dependent DNA polymerase)